MARKLQDSYILS